VLVAGVSVAIMFRSIGVYRQTAWGEAIEEIETRLSKALEATGASRFKVIVYAIVPQVNADLWRSLILRWDIKHCANPPVLGSGGRGRHLGSSCQEAIDTFNWPVGRATICGDHRTGDRAGRSSLPI